MRTRRILLACLLGIALSSAGCGLMPRQPLAVVAPPQCPPRPMPPAELMQEPQNSDLLQLWLDVKQTVPASAASSDGSGKPGN